MNVKIDKDTLFPFLIFNEPFQYSEHITLHPVTMKNIVSFQILSKSITLRKNSIFHDKKIIKMSYLDFILYCFGNDELGNEYGIPELSNYYLYIIKLLELCCPDSKIDICQDMGNIKINEEPITPQMFDDLRRIIIIQNDIDFDIDEFINHDTEKKLLQAQSNSNKDHANIEDYVDSLVIAMNTTENDIMNMTIRKFWRYIKRYQLHEGYKIAKTGECSGMVSFKEPIRHWMISLDQEDRYEGLKTDENSLKGKIANANG